MQYNINEIVNKFLITEDRFMPETHLKQPGCTYSACGPFSKNKKRIQKLKEQKQEIQDIYTEIN